MSVPEQTPYKEYTANGSTTSFALGFICDSKNDLIVMVGEIEPPIASWSLDGGNVVFTTAPAAGQKITLQRNTPFGRTTDYQSFNNSFRPQSVNGDFDRIWLKLQELGVADWLMKLYVDRLHREQKEYIDQKDDELKNYLIEEIRKQGVALDQLEDYYNRLMQRLAEIALEGGWTDSVVATWTGRNQEQKNKDYITGEDVKQYGFTKFESENSGLPVDLLGNVYSVTTLPTANNYFNGYFSVNGTLKLANKFYTSDVLSALNQSLERVAPVATIAPDIPEFANTYIQSAARSGDYLYTLQDNRANTSAPSDTLISRFSMIDDTLTYLDSMLPSSGLGHQSLAIDDQGYLWSRGVDASTGVVGFKYTANTAPTVQRFLISDRIVDVTISSDGRWLIGRGGYDHGAGSIQTFVIYGLDKLISGGAGNYVGQHSYYFEAVHSSHSVQSSQTHFSDGKYIYFLRSNTGITNPSTIYVYDFNGKFLKSFDFNVGRADILTKATIYEPQWIDLKATSSGLEIYAGVSSGANKVEAKNYVFNVLREPLYKSTDQVEKYIGSSIGIGTNEKLKIDEYTNLALNIKASSRDLSSTGMLCTSIVETSSSSLIFSRSLGESNEGVQTPVTLGTNIARIVGKSAISTGGFSTSAGIYMQVDATPTAARAPANVAIYTYDAVSDTNIARFRVNSNGSADFMPASTTEYAAKFSRGLTGDLLQFDIQGNRMGSVYSTSATFYLVARNGKNLGFGFSEGADGAPSARLILSGDGTAFRPAVDNNLNLGSPTLAFKDEYFRNAPIITSDERLKQQFRSQTDREKDAALEIKNSICLYKFNESVDLKGDGARWHVGVKAQQVVSILESHGLNPFEYGFVCFDEWDEQQEVINSWDATAAEYEVVQEYREAGSRYAIRYDELVMFILAAV